MMTQGPNAESRERFVEIPAGVRRVRGILSLPRAPGAVVAFAHGSGSGRFSPRNQFVARALQGAGRATLLIDRREEDEARGRQNGFDIERLADRRLADRLGPPPHWLGRDPDTCRLRLGYLGASTGAAAALVPAARPPEAVGA